ncbi:taste receptor type 1 member 2-like [Rana temporaria]|uniref:taste receptor type 1 member 2-like n=1 Tax=Rana temporaria TaxID=8407 RepID=UPI001AACFA31|nr:taste receptor type 1 member 2-like [Rana temporaria]
MRNIQYKLEDQENRNRRNNLRICALPESVGNNHQLLEGLIRAEVKSITLSDHAPVVVSLELKDIPDRQRSWRLDGSFLYDQAIVEDLEGELSLFFIENNIENIAPTVLWEAHKVSYGATDYSLSDRLLYPHVFRTVQNDHVCYLGITKLVKLFGWNWVGILFSDDDTGETEAQILKRHLASQEICVAFEKRITVNYAAMDQWTDSLHKVNCKVLILCGSFTSNAEKYIVEYTRINKDNILILPPAWTLEKINLITLYQSFITCLNFEFSNLPILRNTSLFDDDLLSKRPQVQLLLNDLIVTLYNITSTQNGKNIYFQNVTTSSHTLIRFTVSISGRQTLYGESVQVYFAVEAMAEAIHYFTKINRSFNINRFKQLHKYVKQIKNPFKIADRMTFFDDNGEFPLQYTIANWMCAFGSIPSKSYIDVGLYTPWAKEEDQIHIDPNEIIWNQGNNKKLESRCADTCLPGSRKKQGSSIHSCCYGCVPCSEGQISNTTGEL